MDKCFPPHLPKIFGQLYLVGIAIHQEILVHRCKPDHTEQQMLFITMETSSHRRIILSGEAFCLFWGQVEPSFGLVRSVTVMGLMQMFQGT